MSNSASAKVGDLDKIVVNFDALMKIQWDINIYGCFIRYPNTSNFVKNTPLRIIVSTLFSVFGYPDETLSLMLDILLHKERCLPLGGLKYSVCLRLGVKCQQAGGVCQQEVSIS